MASTTRKQATRFAVLAFVAADCAGIYYAQHRLAAQADAAQRFADQTPGALDQSNPAALTFSPAPARLAAKAVAAAPALALGTPAAAAPKLALAAAPQPLAPAVPALRAPRIAPVAGLGAARVALTVPAIAHAPAPLHVAAHALAPTPAPSPAPSLARAASAAAKAAPAPDSAFDNAFALYDEAPEAEHRFGQGSDSASGSNLADLVPPREIQAPIVDKAGIGTVEAQAATVDAPADVPADADTAEPAPVKG